MFNLLAGDVADCSVLDLFAGTGALGIEALSRGASYAVFVDRSVKSIQVIRKNISACGLEDRSKILRRDISRDINSLKSIGRRYDLVFMDPPYHKDLVRRTLSSIAENDILIPEARIVIEHGMEEPIDEKIRYFEVLKQKRYGKTLVTILHYMVCNGTF